MVKTAPPADVRLTPDEVAQRWKVDRATVCSLIRAGRLRAMNVGLGPKRATWRVLLADVLDYEVRHSSRAS
jgi:excisionase family DNA binding protein